LGCLVVEIKGRVSGVRETPERLRRGRYVRGVLFRN